MAFKDIKICSFLAISVAVERISHWPVFGPFQDSQRQKADSESSDFYKNPFVCSAFGKQRSFFFYVFDSVFDLSF